MNYSLQDEDKKVYKVTNRFRIKYVKLLKKKKIALNMIYEITCLLYLTVCFTFSEM